MVKQKEEISTKSRWWVWAAIGLAVIVIGYLLLSGSGSTSIPQPPALPS